MQELYLKANADRRLRRGHPWVYSNEIDVARSPLKGLDAGATVRVCDAKGAPLGCGFASPGSLICVRLLSRDERLAPDWLTLGLSRALAWRERLYDAPYYRLVFGEGDGLPGLVVDRFDDVFVAQVNTWGMERQREVIAAALQSVCGARQVIFDDSTRSRALEGLPTADGDAPAIPEQVIENGFRYRLPAQGQKTGWFFDQRDNRAAMRPWVAGARVLDLYSYAGGWGLLAAASGAAAVTCVDSSKRALDAIERCAADQDLPVSVHAERVERFLPAPGAAAPSVAADWDIVILDPPALIARRKDVRSGTAKYRALHRQALAAVRPGGLLISCSCSAHLDADAHLSVARAAGRALRRDLAIVWQGGLGADHPTHAAIPESRYLSCWFLRVT
ncbi:MAG: class I SAM-dependent rRNA methyltransferase [Pseudomonadota bacterium]